MTAKAHYTDRVVTSVGCSVQHCKFQEEGHCAADHIDVQNRTAETKGETFCDTFTPKSMI
ncbi:MAG: DUF1540 domain-containing protein [Oscillospiraceae bacterium]|nr:DUF1540 domain-containing protein [Oscillospiraceae bacterium]MBR3082989.1 DUF1540 domain-containing protein [Oscillospiraceae bacterium]MBR3860900.1 DUF1540 domain-containing protein [Oscillospiraceae bacterium]MBR6096891.1 DUF1540 domain-containing protein [Oscillospiraceae bacterium]MBR7056910.1 DUF1540 domain-containing protein [Oscillospiraceae bacterium]